MINMILANAIVTAAATRQQMDGVEHLVIPVTALVSGILNNVYYSPEAMATFANTWNGVPITAGHPKKDGIFVSANDPEFENTVNIGKFYNVDCTDGKLTGEMWINVEKANRLGFESIVEDAENGTMAEVSTGLFCDVVLQPGIHDNVSYNLVAASIHSDHLAVLAEGEVGACSNEDGCGTFQTNAAGEQIQSYCGEDDCATCSVKTEQSKISAAFKSLGEMLGLTVKQEAVIANQDEEVVANEMSHEEIRRAIDTALDTLYQNQEGWPWLRDVFDDDFVFEWQSVLYRQSYYEKDGVITLGEETVKVVRTVKYELLTEVEANADTIIPNQDEEIKMTEKELVAALIANEATAYTEADTKVLLALGKELLEKMQPVVVTETEEETEEVAAVEAVANGLSDEDNALFGRLKAQEVARVTALRAKVAAANPHLTKEMLANLAIDVIEAMAGQVKPTANYAAAGGTAAAGGDDGIYTRMSVLLNDDEATTETIQ